MPRAITRGARLAQDARSERVPCAVCAGRRTAARGRRRRARRVCPGRDARSLPIGRSMVDMRLDRGAIARRARSVQALTWSTTIVSSARGLRSQGMRDAIVTVERHSSVAQESSDGRWVARTGVAYRRR